MLYVLGYNVSTPHKRPQTPQQQDDDKKRRKTDEDRSLQDNPSTSG